MPLHSRDVCCINTVVGCNVLTFAFPRWQATQAALTCARLGLVTDEPDDSWGRFASGLYGEEDIVDSLVVSFGASLRGPTRRSSFAISLRGKADTGA